MAYNCFFIYISINFHLPTVIFFQIRFFSYIKGKTGAATFIFQFPQSISFVKEEPCAKKLS